jgi:hypothetical protein
MASVAPLAAPGLHCEKQADEKDRDHRTEHDRA